MKTIMKTIIKILLKYLPYFTAAYVLLLAGLKVTDWEYWVALLCIVWAVLVEFAYSRLEE